jgi:hypothetical protein
MGRTQIDLDACRLDLGPHRPPVLNLDTDQSPRPEQVCCQPFYLLEASVQIGEKNLAR